MLLVVVLLTCTTKNAIIFILENTGCFLKEQLYDASLLIENYSCSAAIREDCNLLDNLEQGCRQK
jgi:hypothetical protein